MPFTPEDLLELETRIREMREEGSAEEKDPAPPAESGSRSAENSTIKAIRAEAKRAEKRAAEAEAELEDLRRFKAETTQKVQQETLTAAGLSPRQAEVFLKSFDEVTPEAVSTFKSEVLGVREDAEEGASPSTPFAPTGFVGENQPGMVPVKEFSAMMASPDPAVRAKADALAREGKVAFKNA